MSAPLLGLLLALLAMAKLISAQRQTVRVHYGYFTEARPIHAACARGWLDYSIGNTDYEVTCLPQTSGGFAVSRLDNGQLDVSNLGSTPMAEAAARGIPLSAVYISHYMGDSQGVYVRSAKDEEGYVEIENPFDLVGRRIGVPFGSTMHYQVLFLLDLFDLQGQVELVNLSPAEIVQAWDSKSIDAAGCWGEARDYILKLGDTGNSTFQPAKTLMSAGVLADWGRPTFVLVAARRQFANEHPEFLAHMVAVLSAINDSFLDNLGEQDLRNVDRWNAQGIPGESMVPSMVDSLMKAGETPGFPSQALENSQRRALDLFVQYTVDEQLSCDFFGVGCPEATTLQTDLLKTAEFLLDQKMISTLGLLNATVDNTLCIPFDGGDSFCNTDILDSEWLRLSQSSAVSLGTLEQSLGRAFPVNEIGRASQGQVSAGDSTCSGLETIVIQNEQVLTFGDGANAIKGKSYSDYLACYWVLRPEDCPGPGEDCTTSMVVEFLALRLWSGDFVRIYKDEANDCLPDSDSKTLLGQFTGFLDAIKLPRIAATGCLLVEFVTDGNQERSYGDIENLGDGLKLSAYSATLCSKPPFCDCGHLKTSTLAWGADCSFTDFCLGTTVVKMFAASDTTRKISSHGDMESASDFLRGAQGLYPNDLDCTFQIEVEGVGANELVEIVIWYDLEESYDTLSLESGANPDRFTSPYIVLTGSSSSAGEMYYVPTDENGFVTLHLTTDSKGRRKGFFAELKWAGPLGQRSSCPIGYSGSKCEIPRCGSRMLVDSNKPFELGRVVSQPPNLPVPAMPWAEYPGGGCIWEFESQADNIQKAVAIRMEFNDRLKLEPHPSSNIGDMIVLRTDGGNDQTVYVEACDSDEMCGLPWQTGECSTTEPRACTVRTTVELPIEQASHAEVLFVSDRNDGGYQYKGFDFLATLVAECPKSDSACDDIKGAECRDGYCVCKGGQPCACECRSGSKKVKIWLAVFVVMVLFLLFLAYFLWYRRKKIQQSRVQKALIEEKEAQLEAFRNSVVGMRIARVEYVPNPPVVQQEQAKPRRKNKVTKKRRRSQLRATWCWKETDFCMSKHKVADIVGDASDCWIKYPRDISEQLEAAYLEQGQRGHYNPLPGYLVDFGTMTQKKLSTGFQREVQRIDHVHKRKSALEVNGIDQVQHGPEIPPEIAGEPQMVLVVGDIIQISSQRDDGWAFGTKLLHSDEARSRDLVDAVTSDSRNGPNEDDSDLDEPEHILTDTGWFQISATEIPSGDDLVQLQENVGDSNLLAAPEIWTPVADPTLVELMKLDSNSAEAQYLLRAFQSTLHKSRVNIEAIHRIQNLAMWQSYVVKRETICYRETGGSDQNGELGPKVADDFKDKVMKRFERRWLWHGTNAEVMDKIMQQGFNRSFCGKNATMYGKGVYFARDASYSAYPTYAVPDKNGFQYIMACRVVVGEYCRGKKDALTPDIRDVASQSLYDSTVGLTGGDDMSNPSIYVTYHDAQAYPEYLIKFSQS